MACALRCSTHNIRCSNHEETKITKTAKDRGSKIAPLRMRRSSILGPQSSIFNFWLLSVKACSAIRLVQQFDDVRDAAIGVEHSRARAQSPLACGVGSDQNLGFRGLRFADLIGEQAF